MTLSAKHVLCIALALPFAACGGSSAQGSKAKHAGAHGTGSEESEPASSEENAESEESGPAPSRCADGSCSECGQGLCPKGFYCDESAPGGAACGWLPECAKDASCACVKAGLGAGCECEEKNGAAFVKCN